MDISLSLPFVSNAVIALVNTIKGRSREDLWIDQSTRNKFPLAHLRNFTGDGLLFDLAANLAAIPSLAWSIESHRSFPQFIDCHFTASASGIPYGHDLGTGRDLPSKSDMCVCISLVLSLVS